ncbi:MAG TPA: GGDEF domain-containing protein [Solirubrobacterales bacterium]|nr:GGDEF domain-containing protein [Solirubrobacterales bacterium]
MDQARPQTPEGKYAGADPVNATRLVAVLAGLSGVLTICFLPLDPPTRAIGDAGWPLAVALIAANLALAAALIRREKPIRFGVILAVSYGGMGGVALLQWLGGGAGSTYQNLYLLWLLSAMGNHPPRRALLFLACTALAAFSPLVYEAWSAAGVRETAGDFLLWSSVGLVTLALMTYVRAQRVRLQEEERSAQRLARADPLTELGNRRAFDEALEADIARAMRTSATVSIAVIDLDGFKEINDRFGHLEGDRCLTRIAETLRSTLRAGDRAYRWGGDEFVLLFADADAEGADSAVARIAAAVSERCTAPDGTPISVCWGIAELSAAVGPDDLLPQADLALMANKRSRLGAEAVAASGSRGDGFSVID